jgi:hypothetical protein
VLHLLVEHSLHKIKKNKNMKTKLTILLMIGASVLANAQKTRTGLLQSNFTLSQPNSLFPPKTIGLHYITNSHKNYAYRFGLQYNSILNSNANNYFSGTKNNSYLIDFFVKSYTIDLGMEYRNFITKNIYLYAGADFYLGSNYRSVYVYSVITDTTANTSKTVFENPLLVNSLIFGIKPFAGIRANFGRVVLGYQFNTNVYFNKDKDGVKSTVNWRGLGLQQNVTLAFKLRK